MSQFTDIIIAVHGIGEQSRFSTVRSVATRLACSETLLRNKSIRPVAPQPLGYFHSDVKKITSACLLDDAEVLAGSDLASIGFAEVFWADIPAEVVADGRTMEETKAWARTVVARANALCRRAEMSGKRNSLVPPDFTLAGEVLDEIIETVYVLENLTYLAEKAGLFKFELKRTLEQYLGDVQLVAEFGYHRKDIVGRFHQAMEDIYKQQCRLGNPNVRLHIVAHSEGTVVSFLGLLHAMSGRQLVPGNPDGRKDAHEHRYHGIREWIKHVHGYMTIGSPIDKHLLLWERLWQDFKPALGPKDLSHGQIRWRNYYDFGDPVGFKLDTARLWLRNRQFNAFQFCGCPKCRHDIGYARYVLPGAAHNQYWNDSEVFEHFVRDVVKPESAVSILPEDILDLKSLASKLKAPPPRQRVSYYLQTRLSEETRRLVAQANGSSEQELRKTMADDLNRLIKDKDLYDTVRFKGVPRSPDIRALLPKKGTERPELSDSDRFRLNRALLAEAYPREIRRLNRPATKRYIYWLSPTLPYLLSFLLLVAGVLIIYRAVHTYTHPGYDPLQRYLRFTQLGVTPSPDLSGWEWARAVGGFAALIAGATLLARFPRLAVGQSWRQGSWSLLGPLLRRLKRLAKKLEIPVAVRTVNDCRRLLVGKARPDDDIAWFWRLLDHTLSFIAGQRWFLVGILSFLLGCWLYLVLVPFEVQSEISGKLWRMRRFFGENGPTLGVFGVAALAGLFGYLVTWRFADPDRRKRWFLRGTRPLIICGAAALFSIVQMQLSPRGFDPNLKLPTEDGRSRTVITNEMTIIKDARLTRDELFQLVNARGTNWLITLKKVRPVISVNPPVWPVVLAGAAFLYLWWLAILIFDLAFVWHRYVRRSTTNDRLREWNPYKLPAHWRDKNGDEPCCNPESSTAQS